MIEAAQKEPSSWGIVKNRRNVNGQPGLVKNNTKNEYNRVSDEHGIERYQSIPLYKEGDLTAPERYARDGSWVRLFQDTTSLDRVEVVDFEGVWLVPSKYITPIDATEFNKVIFVDRTNQNIAVLERSGSKWLVRSMNPATTGLHNPPYAQETPLGMFVIQEKKEKMLYVKDGTDEIAGYAPYASRFSNGGYIHGVPVNNPDGKMIEYSKTLGTTPRSHMCVRNATSHAKFIYDWAPAEEGIVVVLE